MEDVDEPPAFVNGPKPYLAVVAPGRPLGMHVYKFVARDEAGDGDSEVDYVLINTERESSKKKKVVSSPGDVHSGLGDGRGENSFASDQGGPHVPSLRAGPRPNSH